MHLFAFLVLVGLVWAILSVFFQSAIRPVVSDFARFRLFALRDELRTSGKVSKNMFCRNHLDAKINRLICITRWVTFGHLIEAFIANRPIELTDEAKRFYREADGTLKRIDLKTLPALLIALLANSPIWGLLIMLLIALLIFVVWVLRVNRRIQNCVQDLLTAVVERDIQDPIIISG